MAVCPIITVPDSRLRQVSKRVDQITPEILKILDDMMDTMYAEDGAGLAAIQIGVPLRLITFDLRPQVEENQPMRLINPEITWRSENKIPYSDGCLSVPGQRADVLRHEAVHFKYTDIEGKEHHMEVNDFLAIGIQHEFDHLEGRLFTDLLPPMKRDAIIRKAQRYKKHNA